MASKGQELTGFLQGCGPWFVTHAPVAGPKTMRIWAALVEFSGLQEEEDQEEESEWEEEGERREEDGEEGEMKLEGVCGGILEGVEVGAEGRFLKVRGKEAIIRIKVRDAWGARRWWPPST